jgi:hypothetical protein
MFSPEGKKREAEKNEKKKEMTEKERMKVNGEEGQRTVGEFAIKVKPG